jgi:segregation and condensation protein B
MSADGLKREGVAESLRKLEEAFARAEGHEAPFDAAVRAAEALLFVAGEALAPEEIAQKIPPEIDAAAVLARLKEMYAGRGVELVEVAGKWRFQTAADLAHLFVETREQPRRLSKAALECLAVIAYHQPVTRAEVEEIRGVALSRGTLDLLLEIGWVRPRGRRRTPGRPVTYGTTEAFLSHFSLSGLDALPGREDLKAAGVLDARLPPGFETPRPSEELAADEEPLAPDDDGPEFFVDHLADPNDAE